MPRRLPLNVAHIINLYSQENLVDRAHYFAPDIWEVEEQFACLYDCLQYDDFKDLLGLED